MNVWKLLRLAGRRQTCQMQHSTIELLESRSLLSAGPQLLNVQLLGGAQYCTGVVLTFNESLDPLRASNAAAYSIGKVSKPKSSGSSLLSSFLPFLARPKTKVIYGLKVRFAAANYDDASHSVTLIPNAPFQAWKFFQAVRIRGTGLNAITDISGNPFDGNSNGSGGDDMVINWISHKGKTITFKDVDGDKVTFNLKGAGKIFTIQHPAGSPLPMLFVQGLGPNRSILSGRVIPGKNGDGLIDIAQVTGLASANVTILTNPAFNIGSRYP